MIDVKQQTEEYEPGTETVFLHFTTLQGTEIDVVVYEGSGVVEVYGGNFEYQIDIEEDDLYSEDGVEDGLTVRRNL